jgi:hypothetical protein
MAGCGSPASGIETTGQFGIELAALRSWMGWGDQRLTNRHGKAAFASHIADPGRNLRVIAPSEAAPIPVDKRIDSRDGIRHRRDGIDQATVGIVIREQQGAEIGPPSCGKSPNGAARG